MSRLALLTGKANTFWQGRTNRACPWFSDRWALVVRYCLNVNWPMVCPHGDYNKKVTTDHTIRLAFHICSALYWYHYAEYLFLSVMTKFKLNIFFNLWTVVIKCTHSIYLERLSQLDLFPAIPNESSKQYKCVVFVTYQLTDSRSIFML